MFALHILLILLILLIVLSFHSTYYYSPLPTQALLSFAFAFAIAFFHIPSISFRISVQLYLWIMPTYDLGLERVSLEFATKTIFTDVTQGVFEGDRIGIVGKNGDGKSTLLRLLAGKMQPDSGRVTKRGGLTFGMLDQRDPLDDNATVREAALENREDYEWAADQRSREIVEALLGGINLEAKVGTLSGGQRRRADLARLLLRDWDILALDEPTNHLDVVTIHWLA